MVKTRKTKQKKRFVGREGRFSDEVAQVYGEELERIRTDHGKITTKIIVEESRSSSNVLHDCFEWDDSVAGEKWREQQANDIIRNVMEVVVVEGKETRQRSFFGVIDDKEKIYVPLCDAVSVPGYRQQLLDRIITNLGNLKVLMNMFKEK